MLEKILGIISLKIKGAAVAFRMTMESAEGLLTLTRHVAQQQLLLTATELTNRHLQGKDFKGRCD